jgi:hypothetical protein
MSDETRNESQNDIVVGALYDTLLDPSLNLSAEQKTHQAQKLRTLFNDTLDQAEQDWFLLKKQEKENLEVELRALPYDHDAELEVQYMRFFRNTYLEPNLSLKERLVKVRNVVAVLSQIPDVLDKLNL